MGNLGDGRAGGILDMVRAGGILDMVGQGESWIW